MRLILLVLALVVLLSPNLRAIKPVLDVPPIPSKEHLEYYEDSEELFALKVMEYFQICVALKTQYEMVSTDKIKLKPPSLEDLSDQETAVIARYSKLADSIKTLLLSIPDGIESQELIELRKKYSQELDTMLNLRKKVFDLTIENKSLPFYKANVEQLNSLALEADSLHVAIDMKDYECHEKIKLLFEEHCLTCRPILSVAASGHKFFSPDKRMDTKLNVGTRLTFNASPILGFGKYFDIWLEYIAPRIETHALVYSDGLTEYRNSETWQTNLYSYGMSGNIPDFITIGDFTSSLKIGLGHYWGDGIIYNRPIGNADWQGEVLRFELNCTKFDRCYPLEIYFEYSLFFPSKDMIFNTEYESINYGRTKIDNISLGLRVTLIRTTETKDYH